MWPTPTPASNVVNCITAVSVAAAACLCIDIHPHVTCNQHFLNSCFTALMSRIRETYSIFADCTIFYIVRIIPIYLRRSEITLTTRFIDLTTAAQLEFRLLSTLICNWTITFNEFTCKAHIMLNALFLAYHNVRRVTYCFRQITDQNLSDSIPQSALDLHESLCNLISIGTFPFDDVVSRISCFNDSCINDIVSMMSGIIDTCIDWNLQCRFNST